MSQTAGTSFAGPALGGVIVAAWGTAAAFAIDAASFAVSAGCLLLMSRVAAPQPAQRSSVTSDIRQGLRWTMHQRWLWFGILAVGVANFAAFSPTAVTIPLMVRNVLHQGPAVYGATFAIGGLGALASAVVAGRFGSPRRRMSAIWAALMQAVVPAEMLGRASSVDWLFSICLSPLGIVFAGVLAGSIGVRETVLAGAAISAASCLVAFAPGVRDPDRADYAPVPV
jgi:hypothetical protein